MREKKKKNQLKRKIVNLYMLAILLSLLFLFHNCIGCISDSGPDEDNGTNGENGGEEGESESLTITGKIDLEEAAEQAALLPLPSTPTGDEVTAENLQDKIVVTPIIVRSDLIQRNDFFKYEGEENSDELYDEVSVNADGTFEVPVPTDDEKFYVAVGVKTTNASGFKTFTSKDGASEIITVAKIETDSKEEENKRGYIYSFGSSCKGAYDMGELTWSDGRYRAAKNSVYDCSPWYGNVCPLLINGEETDKLILMEEEVSTYSITTECTGTLTHFFSLMEGDFCNLESNSDGTATLACEPSTQDWQSIGFTTAMLGVGIQYEYMEGQSGFSKYGYINLDIFIKESDKEKESYIYGDSSESEFGKSVYLNDNCLLVGSTPNSGSEGIVHIYNKEGEEWIETDKITTPTRGIYFPIESDDNCQNIVVGGSNTAYLYSYNGTDWVENTIPGSDSTFTSFGNSVSISGDGNYLGACGKYINSNDGECYIYQRSNLGLVSTLKPQIDSTITFGESISITKTLDNNYFAFIGSEYSDEADLFNVNGTLNVSITSSGSNSKPQRVVTSGDYAAMSSGDNVHLYQYANSTWSEIQNIKINNTGESIDSSTPILVDLYGGDKFVAYNRVLNEETGYLVKSTDWALSEVEIYNSTNAYSDEETTFTPFGTASSLSLNQNYYAIGYPGTGASIDGVVVVALLSSVE